LEHPVDVAYSRLSNWTCLRWTLHSYHTQQMSAFSAMRVATRSSQMTLGRTCLLKNEYHPLPLWRLCDLGAATMHHLLTYLHTVVFRPTLLYCSEFCFCYTSIKFLLVFILLMILASVLFVLNMLQPNKYYPPYFADSVTDFLKLESLLYPHFTKFHS